MTSTDPARSERTSAELDDRLRSLRAAAAGLEQEQRELEQERRELEQEQRELEQEQEQRELAKRAVQPTSRDVELGAVRHGRVVDSGGVCDGSDDSALPVATVVRERERESGKLRALGFGG